MQRTRVRDVTLRVIVLVQGKRYRKREKKREGGEGGEGNGEKEDTWVEILTTKRKRKGKMMGKRYQKQRLLLSLFMLHFFVLLSSQTTTKPE
jgi:hypothetical protein